MTGLPGISGRVALVTGGGSGIGEAVARRFGEAGALVAVADRDAEGAIRVAAEIAGARACKLDVSSAEEVSRVVDEVEAALGPVHVLAHVAGIFLSSPFLEMTDAAYDRLFDTNARGVFNSIRAVGRRMVPRGAGAIVTVASQSARVVRLEQAAYGASKAAASYLTKSCGLELARHGIRCNVVHPGVTDTPLAHQLWDKGVGSAQAHVDGNAARYRAALPLGRVGSADAVADAVVFLASDLARHITMEDVLVDGGASLIA